jgi:uncharacterized protein YjbI with pentapeptide repeats
VPLRRPTIRHFPQKPPKPPVETDLKTLGDAANEAAKRESAQWFYFLTIMITLAALVGSTTHRVLFLEDPVRVPILGVELPLLGFYVAAPAIFVVLHFYLLAQLQLMAGKVNAFLDAVEAETAPGSEQRARALRRLDSFSVAQLMAADRFGARSLPLRLMVSVTLVLAPLLLLLFFQIRFLPHHTESITLWHQALVTADVVLIWWLWPFAQGKGARWRRIGPAMMGSLGVLGFSWVLAVIPGDDPESGWLNAIRAPLFDGRTDDVTQRATSPFARRLILLDQVFLTEAERKTWAETPEDKRDQIGRTRVLRGRDLRFAELLRADLRGADLTGARLQGAVLAVAQMQGALLIRAEMQGAFLFGAEMQRANLFGAQMQGANLYLAEIHSAVLADAALEGAILSHALLAGADLSRAMLRGADLSGAQLQGAILREARMEGAVLRDARMHGVLLSGAQMQGADLSGARLEAADLHQSEGWRLRATRADLSNASLNTVAFGADPPCEELAEPGGSCSRYNSWPQAVETWLASIPEREDRRSQARARFSILLAPNDPPEAELAATSWSQAATPDAARVAHVLGSIACHPDHAPHYARGVFSQMPSTSPLVRPPYVRDLGPHWATLAARILGNQCPGAQGLTVYARSQIARIAASLD